MSDPNEALATLIDEAGMSAAGLARRVNDLAPSQRLNYDYTAVYRWIRKGERPRGLAPNLIALALSEALGRQVTAADIGMAAPEHAPPAIGFAYVDQLDAATNTVVGLWRADLDELATVTAAPISPGAWTDATLSWLVRSGAEPLPQRDRAPRVGLADVARARATVDAFAKLDNQFGGAHARYALVQYLRSDLAGLLQGQYSEETGRELFSAAAEATLLAAWSTYDAGIHGMAQRYFIQALRLAQAADNALLCGSILDAMSHQATFVGRHREAVNLARAARTGTQSHATATLTAHFHAMEARALAAGRDVTGSQRALSEAVRVFERRQPGTDPDWIGYFDDAELFAEFSHCFRDLGRATDAISNAERSLDGAGASPRSDFFVAMVLAEGYRARGDVEEACSVVRRALGLGEQLRSARCVEYLRQFRQHLGSHVATPVGQELSEYAADHPLWILAG